MKYRGVWWNVWLDARDRPNGAEQIADRVSRLIEDNQLDWICLQEVFRYDKLGRRGDVFKLIEQATGWKGAFVVHSRYDYENGRARRGNNYIDGVATFSKWPIKSHHVLRLGPQHKHLEREIGRGRRSLLEVKLDTPAGEIVVGNTHWTRIHYKHRSHRKSEMSDFQNHIAKISQNTRYVVGGDFNTLPSHPTIQSLRESLDLRTGSSGQSTWVHKGKRSLIRSNLDYVGALKNGPVKIVEFKLLPRRPSDHSPLLATFEV